MFLGSSLFCEHHNTEISKLYLSFALQAKEVWDIRKGHSACFHACSGDRQVLPRVLFVMTASWVLISHLSDEAVEGDKHFSLFVLQDSDVTLWLQQQHALFLYFAITLWIFFILPKISPSSWRKGEKTPLFSNFFLCSLFVIIFCYIIGIWYFLWTWRKKENKINKKYGVKHHS